VRDEVITRTRHRHRYLALAMTGTARHGHEYRRRRRPQNWLATSLAEEVRKGTYGLPNRFLPRLSHPNWSSSGDIRQWREWWFPGGSCRYWGAGGRLASRSSARTTL